MGSRGFITGIKIWALLLLFVIEVASTRASERIALLTPEPNAVSSEFAERLSDGLAAAFTVVDRDLAGKAYYSHTALTPFNMTKAEARAVAATIGSELIVEIKGGTQRRNAARRGEYYEAYAMLYLVSGRTGRLLLWDLKKFESNGKEDAEKGLLAEVASAAQAINEHGRARYREELREPPLPSMEEPPAGNSSVEKNFKAPIPFRRIKPEYTSLAAFYEIAGTVDIEVDLDAEGRILRTEIVKWAGFGLDQSVEKAVREMNWRPAERNGKFLPMRFLLRYNFKKIEKE
jgi:TonB family protein